MIDQQLLRLLRDDINAALEAVGAKHNVRLSAGRAVFSPAEATFKLYVAAKTPDGKVIDKDAECFKTRCHAYGLTPGHLGRTFSYQGRSYAISGLQPKRRRYPIVCSEEGSGKRVLFVATTVLNALN